MPQIDVPPLSQASVVRPVPLSPNACGPENLESAEAIGDKETLARPPRIAVIGIHGVADQVERETAHAAATLLQQSHHALYSPFEAATVRLPVTRPDAQYTGSSPDLLFTAELLADAEVPADERVYETIRLCATRRDPQGKMPPREVHVFEMYWGDLSRATGNFARIFIEFYQLAFQIASLGRETLRLAVHAEPDNRCLGLTRKIRDSVEWLLTLVVPILNIVICWFAFALLPLALRERDLPLANAVLAVLANATLFALFWRGDGGKSWLVRLPWLMGIGVVMYWLIQGPLRSWGGLAMSCLLLATTSFAFLSIWKSYEIRRRGARWIGPVATVLGALAFGWGVVEAIWHKQPLNRAFVAGGLRGVDLILFLLWAAWIILYIFQVAHSVFCIAAGYVRNYSVRHKHRQRALWTGELSVIMPLLVVTLLNVTFWQGLKLALPKVIPTTELNTIYYHPLKFRPGNLELLKEAGPGATEKGLTATHFINGTIDQSCALLPRAAFLVVLGFLVIGWGLLPAILLETAPPKPNNPSSHEATHSRWHGRTLTAGFWGMRVVGEIIRMLIMLSTISALLWLFIHSILPVQSSFIPEWLSPTYKVSFLGTMLSAIGVAFIALLFSSGMFGSLAFGFRAALDVALDVINWLRRDPAGQTPRARIFARYQALLQHLKVCEHHDGRVGYDAIVILAHSQGTVITADVLRFLAAQSSTRPLPPIHLFTMGCPLRQLYSLRFPHLYGWVRDPDETAKAQEQPTPGSLGATRWWNTYRSADYVGRYLWQSENVGDPWTTGSFLLDKNGRREWCLGAGAHTHYWDEHGLEVGTALDELVATA